MLLLILRGGVSEHQPGIFIVLDLVVEHDVANKADAAKGFGKEHFLHIVWINSIFIRFI